MRKFLVFAVIIISFLLCVGCGLKNNDNITRQDISGKTYVYEKNGVGSSFTITIEEDGTFTYYEGFLSSYIGHGSWAFEGEVLTLSDVSYDIVNHFKVKKDRLIYLAEGSKGFIYVDVSDGDVFNLTEKRGTVFVDDTNTSANER